ncbi:type II toxin-antitoxin system RelE/ParE family toxin [Neisseria chenwenguii]|uniref:Addiction module toxin RelE n=1 Tax=Neisseria chenwenguii TaxID=1853278 RepID=A0A220S103_9NEIS|nr:type II toxin-antitoxin system RelE/ParE family toxin [Neisseria chenwenguii]ASK27159.1 addiction module toxin RelE [Neisseria chenwenguii]ROV56581.1 type II toxin-antitoxin system RelE/ParE family toxin [Neisseria chenwenguii]
MPLLLDWTKSALTDVDEIVDFIFSENPAAAFEFEQLVQESANNLVHMPYIGRSGRIEYTRELIFHPNYFIAYEMEGGKIKILRVLHTRRKYPE